MVDISAYTRSTEAESHDLRPLQLVFLAGAVSAVSAGYGALMPLLPAWLTRLMPDLTATELVRQVGFLSGAYTAGVLVGAPLWGLISDRIGRPRILIFGLVGYVVSLLLLLRLPSSGAFWAIYALRAAAGVFVAAVIPVVPALVAAHTPKALRARRFAWLGAASLIGFLFGPVLNDLANVIARIFANGASLAPLSEHLVIVLSAILGASMMFAECALVMLGVNALLFFTSVLNKVAARLVIAVGSLIGIAGLSILALHHSTLWMYIGVSLTSGGTGLVLPVISFLAAGTSRHALGATMGTLAAASGLGQTLGSVTGGWLFGWVAQGAFGWLAMPLVAVLILLLAPASWLSL